MWPALLAINTRSIFCLCLHLKSHLKSQLKMAATTYASLVSLMNVLTRYQHPACPVHFEQSQLQTLLDKVGSLVEFLENYDSQTKTNRGSIRDLEWKMTRVAYAVKDMIESSYVNRVFDDSRPPDFLLCSDLEIAIREMDQFVQESKEVGVKKHKSYHSLGSLLSISNQMGNSAPVSVPKHQDEDETPDHLALTLTPTLGPHPLTRDKKVLVGFGDTNLDEIPNTKTSMHVHSSSSTTDKNIVVGFDEQLRRLMDRIRKHNPKRVIIPIVGMGGIGKTTLARNAFNSQYACHHFDIRAWVTISQSYGVRNIIVSLLEDVKLEVNDQLDEQQLGDTLYKGLCGRRYLIVLDDIWDIQAWNEIMRFFPERNGSRILLTTRDHSIARRVGSSNTFEMEFLGDDASFKLLSEKVYGTNVFPSELEILGKAIARSCKGLPLAIVVIGGLLKTCSKTLEYWKEFADNISSVLSEGDNGECLAILSLSYTHLPIHLKTCFLYMSTFKEDEEIDISNLTNLWIAEGFLKPTNEKLLNDIAFEYLIELIDRNLIMVVRKGLSRKIKMVSVHDSLRELCIAEARKKYFVSIDAPNLQQTLDWERRYVYKHSAGSRSRDVLCCLCQNLPQVNSFHELLRMINVRYLEVSVNHLAHTFDTADCWFRSLPLFWNLETFIFGGYRVTYELPSGIWDLPYLRHLEFTSKVFLPIPTATGGQSKHVLNNLQTIRNVDNLFFNDDVFRMIPNLKELSIRYTVKSMSDYDKLLHSFNNLALLPNLETLKVSNCTWGYKGWALRKGNLSFSSNIVELELDRFGIPWEDMAIVGRLPNLQVLILENNAFCGNEWNSNEGEFQRLKYLSIRSCRLNTWNTDSCHFPTLEHLELCDLGLKEIPLEIGEIQSLESINLDVGELSIIISVKEILNERHNQGDDDLVVTGYYWGVWSEQTKELANWAQAHQNFRLSLRNEPEKILLCKNWLTCNFCSNRD